MSLAESSNKLYLVDKYFSEFLKAGWHHRCQHGKDGMVQGPPGQEVFYGGSRLQRTSTSADVWNSCSSSNLSMYTQLGDLIHLPGPLTEDAVIKTLQARFYAHQYYTNVGPVLLAVNPHNASPGPRALSCEHRDCPRLERLVKTAVQQQAETGMPQAVVINGASGSGKTHTSTLVLRQLFGMVGGGTETDQFKHLSAALTVLRALGSAATIHNQDTSRMGFFIESHVADSAIYRNKLHCYLLDQSRVTRLQPHERTFHIFYYLLYGLSQEDKVKYHLGNHSPKTLHYMSQGATELDTRQLPEYWEAWKSSLSSLGIPLADVVRLLAAILLLGNLTFVSGTGLDLEVQGNNEMKSIAALLGMSSVQLYRALTSRSKQTRGQVHKTTVDAATANHNRDTMARALYSRSVAAIIKRANSSRRPPPTSANSSSSNESSQGSPCSSSLHHSSHGGGVQAPKSPAMSRASSLSRSSRVQASDTFIGVLDMFGFEDMQVNELEQLCINLYAETLQHFYNTLVFKTTEEVCVEEGIQADMDIYYMENAPIVELISSQRTGLLGLLDVECVLQRASAATYLQKVRIQHKIDTSFQECPQDAQRFAIRHYAGCVQYDVGHFLGTNRDTLTDDVIYAFAKHNCNFGFVNHLFTQELKVIQEEGGAPRGLTFRITGHSSSSVEKNSSASSLGTFCQDVHTRLDGLLKTLVQTKPHFIRCFKANKAGESEVFEREVVVKQLRANQVLETLHLMAAGFPHKMRYKAFNSRYRPLLPGSLREELRHVSDNVSYAESKHILERLMNGVDGAAMPYISTHWALGKKHIFLSENARQMLERVRSEKRHSSATLIQKQWRCSACVKRWPALRRQLEQRRRHVHAPVHRKHGMQARSWDDQDSMEQSCDQNVLQNTYKFYGLSMEQAPNLPSRRSYTVQGSVKMCYPQTRLMTHNYTDGGGTLLSQGEEVKVVGPSGRPGFLLAEFQGKSLYVPYQLTQLKAGSSELEADI